MGLTVGELSVTLDAATAEFRAGLAAAEQRLDTFEKRANAQARSVRTQFASLTSGVTALRTGIALLVGGALGYTTFRAFQALTSAAAEQEDATQKLRTAFAELGPEAAAVVEELTAFASAQQKLTRFGDETIIDAQARIAAFVKEKGAVQQLTVAAQDLASATGRDLASAADLIAKTAGSSTNALARLGIEVSGVEGSTERVAQIVQGVAGLFGGQAAAAALTYAGGVDQLRNAFSDLVEELGGVITENDTIGSALRDVLIPFFEELTRKVKENKEEIGAFVSTAIPSLLRGFSALIRLSGALLKAFGLVADALLFIRRQAASFDLSNLESELSRKALPRKLLERRLAGAAAGSEEASKLQRQLAETDAEIATLTAQVERARASYAGANQDFLGGLPGLETIIDQGERAAQSFEGFATLLNAGRQGAREANAAEQAAQNPPVRTERTTRTDAETKALEELLQLRAELRKAERSELEQQIDALDEQIRQTSALVTFGADQVTQGEVLTELAERRAQIAAELARQTAALPGRQSEASSLLEQLQGKDPELFIDLRAEVAEAYQQGSVEGQTAALLEVIPKLREAVAGAVDPIDPEALQRDLREALEAKDLRNAIADAFGEGIGEALAGGDVRDAVDRLGDLLGESIAKSFGGDEFGNAIGGVFSGVVSAITRIGEESSSRSSAIRSAVTSTQQVRGIVAGPTQIAVAQVDRALQTAFVETNAILRAIERNTRGASAGASSVTPAAADPTSRILLGESESLY
jgi:hypothetical protein